MGRDSPLQEPLPHDRAPHDPAIDLGRRNFLKLGVVGSAALATASAAATLAGCGRSEQAAAQGFRFLRDADVALFRALIPAIVADALPEAPAARDPLIAETLRRMDAGCYRLGTPGQAQLRKLFDLLNFRLTRVVTTGIFAPWSDAGAGDVDAFLQRWRTSGVGAFNAGYRVLVGLVAVAFYEQPQAWPLSGYPGPLAFVYQAVNS